MDNLPLANFLHYLVTALRFVTPFRLARISELFGAEVSDVDCRVSPNKTLKENILSVLYEYLVLVFGKQVLMPDDLIAFSEAFDSLEMRVNQQDVGNERPNFHTVTNLDEAGNKLPAPESG